jgi:uncharacterized protein YeaO (DUF488 family)
MAHAVADIRTKRVYDPPAKDDGVRVLVDRLWPRGLRKENAAVTLWLKEIAPSAELRKWFGHDPARWTEFSRRYRAELTHNDEAVARLVALLASGPVTLVYSAHDVEHNQALVLADYLQDHRKAAHGHRSA